mgnify:CR=1 FL=1
MDTIGAIAAILLCVSAAALAFSRRKKDKGDGKED